MNVPKLKGCPFCGARGIYRRASDPWVKEPNWTAGCEYGHAGSPDLLSKGEAAEWWNRRPNKVKRALCPQPPSQTSTEGNR